MALSPQGEGLQGSTSSVGVGTRQRFEDVLERKKKSLTCGNSLAGGEGVPRVPLQTAALRGVAHHPAVGIDATDPWARVPAVLAQAGLAGWTLLHQ